MAPYPKPAEDCVSPEFYEVEREAVFKRAWLNVGRVEEFHNICRHRGNKLMWNDFPREETRGSCRAFTCKYHAWRYDLTGKLTFVQQESEFFDLDKDDYGLLPVHCEVWAGFVFVNLAKEPEQTLPEFLGPMITPLDGPHRMVTPGGTNPGKVRKWSMDNFQIFPNMEILIWASGWYLTYRYWPTSYRQSARRPGVRGRHVQGVRAPGRRMNRCPTPSCPRRSRSWNPSPRPGARPPSPSATSAAWRAT
ncbi:aromatic ring-hydroxylating dioxygenase subunit alpha [Streptomyces mirabilis]|uniref:aromatic ring-hydroxylating oxygenase subunit alpha n=1 Tax=Streptomyces mirabilis TaxID=68239 RepID=UPI0037205CED